MVGDTVAMAPGIDSAPFLRELWYMPALASSLRPGDMRREMLLGEPVVLGRMKDGALFALRDICPHRGVPLSAGRIMPEGSVECPYHGWRFKRDGQCSKIPSLTGEESLDIEKIKVRSYPVREQDGLIWVYMAAKPGGVPTSEPPRPSRSIGQASEAEPVGRATIEKVHPMRWTETQTFHCGIDHAVIGLMDPAH